MTSEVHRYKVGDIEVTVLADGYRDVPLENYLRNATVEQLAGALQAAGLPTGSIKNTYAPIVLTIGGKRALFDTGNGEAAFVQSKGQRGRLMHNLGAAGIEPGAIDVVVISHFHGDHVNGLLTADEKPAFPKAEIKVPEVEWKFWMDDGEMSRASKGRMSELFQNNRRVFDKFGRKVTPYAWDKEVLPGVTAVGTPGHSIGHTSYVVASGKDRVYVQSDVNNNAAIFTPNPGWHGFFDQDPVAAEATRRRVYDMLAVEKLPVQGFHHPFPGLSRVEKQGATHRLIPLEAL